MRRTTTAIITSLFLLLSCFVVSGQNQTNIWYFGYNAGIDFNSGGAVALSNGQVNTFEGGSSICDDQGRLLFYSDGLTVWDRTHAVMPNGTGILGGQSSTTSAIIIPNPTDKCIYYLFTVEDHLSTNHAFRYSVIDMSLNGGLGDVVVGSKNIFLHQPCGEKITAIRHQNGLDYWVITHALGNNQFRAYLLTSAGVNPAPVISNVGLTNASNCMIGFMKANHAGTRIVSSQTFCGSTQIFDFDKTTGAVANPATISAIPGYVYGIEFSPNDAILYLSTCWGTNRVYQVNPNNIATTAVVGTTSGNYEFGGMQLGPDGVIYMARNTRSYLSTIANPNVWGAGCNFNLVGFNLAPGTTSGFGIVSFPPEYPMYFYPGGALFSTTDTCFGASTQFTSFAMPPFDSITWDFGDPSSFPANQGAGTTVGHQFTSPGTYSVTMIIHDCEPDTITRTVTILNTPAPDLGADTTFCSGLVGMTLDAGSGYGSYLWSNGNTTQTISIASPGTYWVDVPGCDTTFRDSITVSLSTQQSVTLGNDTTLCFPFAYQLGPVGNFPQILWSTGANTPSILVSTAGLVSVALMDSVGCVFVDTVEIAGENAPQVSLAGSQPICQWQNVLLDAGNLGANYIWTPTGDTTQTIIATTPGTYTVVVSNFCGADSGAVTLALAPTPTVSLGADTTICGGGSYVIDAGPGFSSYLWSTGSSSASIVVSQTGDYAVTVTNAAGCFGSDTLHLTVGAPVSINVQSTNVSCNGLSDGSAIASASGSGLITYQWIAPGNPVGNAVSGLPAGTYTVIATDAAGCDASASVQITEPPMLFVSLFGTGESCRGRNDGQANVSTSGGAAPYSIAWSNGATTAGIAPLAPGIYAVTVTDGNGCTGVGSYQVQASNGLGISTSGNAAFCEGEGGDTLFATATGGSAPYYYTWWCSQPFCGLDSMYDDDPLANPTNSGWYYVQATDGTGCLSSIDSLWIEVLPKPIVDAGNDLIICGDSAPCQILTPTISNAVGPYSYNWMPATGLSDPSILNPCARPDSTTIYTLVVTAGNGCTSAYTTTDTLATVIVNVNPVPIAYAGPDQDICFLDSASLHGLGFGAGPVYAYEWTPASGLSAATIANPHASPPLTTVYTLVVWSNGCPSYGDDVVLNVHTLPTIDAGADKEICLGDSVALDGIAGGDSTATYAYQWSPQAGLNSPHSDHPLVSPASSTQYFLQVVSSFGCSSNLDSLMVHLKPTPIADAGDEIRVCAGQTVQLQGSYIYTTTDSADPGQIYPAWSGSTPVSDSTIFSPFTSPQTSTWYYLDVYYNTCHTRDSMLVEVIPQIDLVVAADTNVICSGDSLEVVLGGGNGAAIFSWWLGNPSGGPNPGTIVFSPSQSTTYQFVASEGGCSDSASLDIQVVPSPSVAALTSSLHGCSPLTVNFIQACDNAIAFVWEFGDGSPISNVSNPSHTYTTSGDFPVSLTAINSFGCSADAVVGWVHAAPKPIADFHIEQGFPVELTLPAASLQFWDDSQNCNEWDWDFGDGIHSNEMNPLHQYSQIGTNMVSLTVTNAEGCVDVVTKGPIVITFPDLFIPNVFSPNEDGIVDFFQVEYSGTQPFLIQIVDRWGVKLFEQQNKMLGWDGKNLSGEDVAEGVYYYVIRIGNKEYVGNVTLLR